MISRDLSQYVVLVRAGPGLSTVSIQVHLYDEDELLIGGGGDSLFAFGATWKDVAVAITSTCAIHGIKNMLTDSRHPSPHLDLT